MSDDFKWFKENYSRLIEQYGNAFLAIKNKQIIGVYETYAEGVRATSAEEEPGTFIVQECSTDDEAYACSIASMNFC